MDAATLATLAGNHPEVDYGAMVGPYNDAMVEANCNTVDRCSVWDSMILEESGGLRWMSELDTGEQYNGRLDLGNTQPGDGPRFKGAGPLQITGRGNFTKVSAWAYRMRKPGVTSPTFFVDHPELLRTTKFGFLGAVWYWTVARPMNYYADRRDIVGATKAVNGGTNGLDVREAIWHAALSMGNRILPTLPVTPPTATQLEEVMRIVIDAQTGRRYLLNGVSAPKYLTKAQANVVRHAHGLPAPVKLAHGSLQVYGRAMKGVHA